MIFLGILLIRQKKGIEQHKKRECLKSAIGKGKAYLLGGKQTQKRIGKASEETVNKKYAEYKQHELNEKGEKTQAQANMPQANMSLIRILPKFLD